MIFLKGVGVGKWVASCYILANFQFSIENVELFTLKVLNVTLGTVVSLKFDPPPPIHTFPQQ